VATDNADQRSCTTLATGMRPARAVDGAALAMCTDRGAPVVAQSRTRVRAMSGRSWFADHLRSWRIRFSNLRGGPPGTSRGGLQVPPPIGPRRTHLAVDAHRFCRVCRHPAMCAVAVPAGRPVPGREVAPGPPPAQPALTRETSLRRWLVRPGARRAVRVAACGVITADHHLRTRDHRSGPATAAHTAPGSEPAINPDRGTALVGVPPRAKVGSTSAGR
jgi:hypothetical protein